MNLSVWPSVSFIVPLFNHLTQTQQMLDSLLACMPQGLKYEIILADDASTDDTAIWMSAINHPHIKNLQNYTNCGYAKINNMAAKMAQGDILALLNNDLLLKPGWLPPMLDLLLSKNGKVGVVGNVQRRVADGIVDHVGMGLNARGQLEHLTDISILTKNGNSKNVERLAVTGACMLLRRADFWEFGGLDEQYRNGAEDIDLCFKLRKHGLRSWVALNSCVDHHVSLTRGSSSINQERNSRLLFCRWRKLIKQELAALWLDLLVHNEPFPEPIESLIDMILIETPHLASLRIAEALLVRQEVRWQELLGNICLN